MAARRRTRYRTRIKRVYRGRGGGGGLKPVVDGAIAGVAGGILQKWLGKWAIPGAAVAVGMWRKNATLKTEGGRELGLMISQGLPFFGGNGGNGGAGGYE